MQQTTELYLQKVDTKLEDVLKVLKQPQQLAPTSLSSPPTRPLPTLSEQQVSWSDNSDQTAEKSDENQSNITTPDPEMTLVDSLSESEFVFSSPSKLPHESPKLHLN